MAESAVVDLVNHLFKLVHKEAALLRGVEEEVNRIRIKLNLLNSYIKDAEEKQEHEKAVKSLVNELRMVAFSMEDLVDEDLLKRHSLLGMVTRGIRNPMHCHHVSSEIENIKTRLEDLYTTRQCLGLTPSSTVDSSTNNSATTPTPRLGPHFVDESEVVGIERKKRELTNWLTGQMHLPVMVVIGPAGIGKTTIVMNVYNKQKLWQTKIRKEQTCYFEFCAWITMCQPQVSDHNMLIRQIKQKILDQDPAASAALGSEGEDPRDVMIKVKEYFTHKRCLIVFDYVQEINVLGVIKDTIPLCSSQSGTKVIITTRNEHVASCFSNYACCKVEPLSRHDAKKLFCQKAFQSNQEQYRELDVLSEKFVEKCNGVPLAIVAIAGLLSTKRKTTIAWRMVLNQLESLLQNNPHLEPVQQVMLESYQDLPSHLKQCFLYFRLFPEGYSINCMRLIRLWVAEGFVKGDTDNTSMEEFAEEYLAELVCRCLVHVSRVDLDGKPKSCHVYNLMHEFIAKICEEQMFCHAMKDTITLPNSNLESAPRRLSIIIKKNDNATMERAEKWKKVRTCFVFDDLKKWLVNEHFFFSFELLVRLDLSNARLDNLPTQVGKLLNLKYLSLRNTNIMFLPNSIGKLKNLQTLDLKQTRVSKVDIKKLVKLRHLLAYFISQYSNLKCLHGVKLSEGLQNLKSLQKLSFLDASDGSIIKGLKQLKNLRKLGIVELENRSAAALCQAIENMTQLCSLSIWATRNDRMLYLQYSFNPPTSLQRLYLNGRLQSLPRWIPKLPNLSKVYLKWSKLKEDPLPYLKDLQQLLHLELYDTYVGDELHFKSGWLKLKVLYLGWLPNLKTIKIDEGAIRCLKVLKIGKCHEMVQVPRDLPYLTSLQKLYFYDMPGQFVESINDNQTQDYMIIKKLHVEEVHLSKDDLSVTLHDLDS